MGDPARQIFISYNRNKRKGCEQAYKCGIRRRHCTPVLSCLGPGWARRICLHWYCHLEVLGTFLVCLWSESRVLSPSVPDTIWSSSSMVHTNLLLGLPAGVEKDRASWVPFLVTTGIICRSLAGSASLHRRRQALCFLSHLNVGSVSVSLHCYIHST